MYLPNRVRLSAAVTLAGVILVMLAVLIFWSAGIHPGIMEDEVSAP